MVPATVLGEPDIAPPSLMVTSEHPINSVSKCKAACVAKGTLCGAYAFDHYEQSGYKASPDTTKRCELFDTRLPQHRISSGSGVTTMTCNIIQ